MWRAMPVFVVDITTRELRVRVFGTRLGKGREYLQRFMIEAKAWISRFVRVKPIVLRTAGSPQHSKQREMS